MDLTTFLQQRRPHWRQLETILARVEGSGLRCLDDDQAIEFGRLYRSAASDLNQVQTFVRGDATVQYLNDLVARCYLVIYAKTKTDPWGLLRLLVWDYPAIFRRHARALLLATVLFLVGGVFGFLAAFYDRDSRAFLLNANMQMIQPNEDNENPLATTGELAAGSSFYFTHNTGVSLIAFALGLTFGIGTAWFMFYNGVIMGALGAVFVGAGDLLGFCTGILPHGVLEIPAILIAGAGGFVLARGMIRVRPWPRREELARAGKEALLLVSGCVPVMAMAGVLEMGVARAPGWFLSSGLKLAVATIFGLLFAVYLLLFGRTRLRSGREAASGTY